MSNSATHSQFREILHGNCKSTMSIMKYCSAARCVDFQMMSTTMRRRSCSMRCSWQTGKTSRTRAFRHS